MGYPSENKPTSMRPGRHQKVVFDAAVTAARPRHGQKADLDRSGRKISKSEKFSKSRVLDKRLNLDLP